MRKKHIQDAFFKLIVLLVIAICVHIVSNYSIWIEEKYSSNWYLTISKIQRKVIGVFPFSIGDFIYIYWIIFLIIIVFDVIRGLIKRNLDKEEFLYASLKNMQLLLTIYIFFNVLWGWNYNRIGVEKQFSIMAENYSKDDLQKLTDELIKKTNHFRSKINSNEVAPKASEIYHKAYTAYQYASLKDEKFDYPKKSIKSSIFGRLNNYLGYWGYYNPFTGEAQVNSSIPDYLLPFTTCHEIAHQVGYASESEANFVGFLAATSFDEPLFPYSAYFNMFLYANYQMRKMDTAQANKNLQKLSAGALADYQNLKAFNARYHNEIEPYIKQLYSRFLKLNNQENGIESYNEVVGWLIAYRKKIKTFRGCQQ